MTEGVFEATVDQVKSHPVIWGSIIVVVIGGLWILSSKSSGSAMTPQNFNFTYGPSDAQVVAGTQLQIAQVQANAQSAMIASQTAADTTIAQDYFGYLTNNSANVLTANQQAIAASVAENGQNVGANVDINTANVNGATYIASLQSKGQLAQIAAGSTISANTTADNYALALAQQASSERIAAANLQTQYLIGMK